MSIRVNASIFKGCLFGIITLIIFIVTPGQVGVVAGEEINSRSFPCFVLTIMGTGSVASIIQGLIEKEKTYWEMNEETMKAWIAPMTVFAIVLTYTLLFPHIGFMIGSVIASTSLLTLVRCKKITYYFISYAFVGIIYFVFTEYLQVPLPALVL